MVQNLKYDTYLLKVVDLNFDEYFFLIHPIQNQPHKKQGKSPANHRSIC